MLLNNISLEKYFRFCTITDLIILRHWVAERLTHSRVAFYLHEIFFFDCLQMLCKRAIYPLKNEMQMKENK